MSAIATRSRTIVRGRNKRTAIVTWGDSYTMCQQSGVNHPVVEIAVNIFGTHNAIELYNVADGLTSTGTNGGSDVIQGPVQGHNGYSSAGTLNDALAGFYSTSRFKNYEFAIGGTLIGRTAGNSWLTNVPDASDNTGAWAAGNLLSTGNVLWTNTYTNYNGDTNNGFSFLTFLKNFDGNIIMVGTGGGNDCFAMGANYSLFNVDQYGRPSTFNSGKYDDVLGVDVYLSLTQFYNFVYQCISLNPHHPRIEIYHAGYQNFPIDEDFVGVATPSITHTPIVDIPNGTALGGAGYTGTNHSTDATVDRSGFWGSTQTNASFPFNTQATAYTTGHSLGTGRFDPEYSSPYHNQSTSPTYSCFGDIINAALGNRAPVPITQVGVLKLLCSQLSFTGTKPLTDTFYNTWYAHQNTDIAFQDFNTDFFGGWQNAFNTYASNAESANQNLYVAVALSLFTNDWVGRAFKGSLGSRYKELELDQQAMGRNFHYISTTWDCQTAALGMGSSAYYSGDKTTTVEGVHPSGTAIGAYSGACAAAIHSNTSLLK